MIDDDAPVGRVLTRREAMVLLGSAGLAFLAACADDKTSTSPTSTAAGSQASAGSTAASGSAAAATSIPSCVVKPALTEGPYFVDEKLNRSDIRSDPASGAVQDGVPLTLRFNVSSVKSNACSSLASATVDVWQCNALGVYSDVTDNAAGNFQTVGQKFLRGYQVTDASGVAEFKTIYPGWYQGRAVHIHFKIRSGNSEFTSQLFFDDALSAQVFAGVPYSQKGTNGVTKNASDDIYRQSGGQLLLQPTRSGDGYEASFDIGLQA